MFGLLVSGRLVDTSFRQVDQTHAVIDISDVGSFNHIVVSAMGQGLFTQFLTYLIQIEMSVLM